ncbi:MAG: GYF domain-containing protein [Gemmataceae bacterium]
MTQEWYYTKDRKGKFGPVSPIEMRTLLESGRLRPNDMVWKQGMKEWVPVSAIEDVLFGGSGNVGRIIALISLPAAAGLALLAGVLAVLSVPIAPAVIGGVSILPGLTAVAVGFSSRKNFPYLASAGTAVFVGVTGLLFSIGAAVWKGRIEEARQTAAKAAEVEEDRAKAEAARKKAREDRDAAEAALEEARKPVKLYLDTEKAKLEIRENAAGAKEAELAKRQTALDACESDLKTRMDAGESDLKKRTASLLAKEKEADDKLSEARKKLDDATAKEILAKETEKKAAAAFRLADEADKDAKVKLEEAAKKLEDARKTETEGLEHHKKIADEYKKLLAVLRDTDRKKYRNAIDALARIGPLPSSVPRTIVDLSEISRELCFASVSNADGIRKDALRALKGIEPHFGSLLEDAIFPRLNLEKRLTLAGAAAVKKAVNELADFAGAGLPLLEAHLARKLRKEFKWLDYTVADVVDRSVFRELFWDEVAALEKIAASAMDKTQREIALRLLQDAPNSEWGKSIYSTAYLTDQIAPRLRKLAP